MKKLFIVLSFLFVTQLFAQEFEGVVHLKNGSTVQGTIIQIVPNESVKIRTKNQKVEIFQMDDVVKITKGGNTSGFANTQKHSENINQQNKNNYSKTANYSAPSNYSINSSTQNLSFKKGTRIFNFKFGFKNTDAARGGFLLGIEYGIVNNILKFQSIPTSLGIGLSVGGSSATNTLGSGYYGTYEESITAILVSGNVFLHFNVFNNTSIDTYVMGALDYIDRSYEYKYNSDYYYEDDYVFNEKDLGSSFNPNILIGIRYFAIPKYAISFELGTGFCTYRFGFEKIF